MKTKLCLLFILLTIIFSCVHAQALDVENDQQIISIMSSDKFVNALIDYQFEDQKYPIRIIHNPKREMLWGNSLSNPSSVALMVIADIPIPVVRHLEDLVLELRGNHENCYFSLKYEIPQDWNFVWPVHIAESINDSINDEIVQNTFNSENFSNCLIYYHLNNQYYQVRLMHNPEGKSFSASKKFRLDNGPSQSFYFSWNRKYAIATDVKAPKELMNHLSASLGHLSYWDWYFNTSVENGTYVTYQVHSGNWITIYDLDTWFNYSESFGKDQKVD